MVKLFKRAKSKDSGHLYFRCTIDGKRRVICTGTGDRKAATEIMNLYLAQQSQLKKGILSKSQVATLNASKLLFAEEVAKWIASLSTRSIEYQNDCKRCVNRIADKAGWKFLGDIDADGVDNWVQASIESGDSSRTTQKHVKAIKQFVSWLLSSKKLASNPLLLVKAPNPKTNRKVRMRMILPEEWKWIESHLMSSKRSLHNMTPQERLSLYELAIQTGLRNSEIRELRMSDLVIGKAACFVTLAAEHTKNKQDAKQFIRRTLATMLAGQSKLPDARLFRMPARRYCAEMLRKDVAAARAAWIKAGGDEASTFLAEKNDKGEVLLFHSLRHTCGAWMIIAGVSPKVVQKVMRHSTIVLTLDTYGHLLPDSEQDAVDVQASVLNEKKRKIK